MSRWLALGFCEEKFWELAIKVGTTGSSFVLDRTNRRIVIEYTPKNGIIYDRHLWMERLLDLAAQLVPEDSFFKLDIRDAYYHLCLRR